MNAWTLSLLAGWLLFCLLYLIGPRKDGPWKRPDRRAARQARRVLKMMRSALPGLLIGAVFGLAAAGSDGRTMALGGAAVWIGGAVCVHTMSRPFGRPPRPDALLVGLSLAAVGVAAVL